MSNQDGKTSEPPISRNDRVKYVHTTHKRLSEAWGKKVPNRSGMRAVFRRWRPDAANDPTDDMRRYVWGWMGSPLEQSSDDMSSGESTETVRPAGEPQADKRREALREKTELDVVDEAAIVTAMRAAAGDHPPLAGIGEALYRAGMNDLRLSRLLTEPKSGRLESLQRAMKLLDAKRIGINWEPSETRNVMDYLFGSDRTAQKAANAWAADFFRTRGKSEKPDTRSATDETSDT